VGKGEKSVSAEKGRSGSGPPMRGGAFDWPDITNLPKEKGVFYYLRGGEGVITA